MKQTSINIQPVKAGSEQHNKREKELDYVRPELSHLNRYWESDTQACRLEKIKATYTAHTGQKMQVKATPIREAVVVIDEQVSMLNLQALAYKLQDRFGIECFQIAIHKDEGYMNAKKWTPNLHAHLVFDWTNPQTGKSIKLNRNDMVEMQTITAEVLSMERGKSSDKKHLNAIQFKAEAEQKRLKIMQEENHRLHEELKNALKPTEIAQNQKIDDLIGKHTHKRFFGLIEGKTDFKAVAQEMWEKRREQETTIVRNEFLENRQYREENKKMAKEIEYLQNQLNNEREKNQALTQQILKSLGEDFQTFLEDVKRVTEDFLMAIGLWNGETWENKLRSEVYTADKNRQKILINGDTIEQRERKWENKLREAYQNAVKLTNDESWVAYRFNTLRRMTDKLDQERELKEILHIASKDRSRGLRR